MTPDPYAPYLLQADELFARGEVVKAGQIWQAILKQQPAHAEARHHLLSVKERLQAIREGESPAPSAREHAAGPTHEPEARTSDPGSTTPRGTLPPHPGRVAPETQDPERLLAEGCTLYDMGQLQDALAKWEGLLALNPAHALALRYAAGARRELGLAPLPAAPSAAPSPAVALAAGEDVDKLLRDAVQLYDMGLTEEAVTKWEQVLALEPHRQEVEAYLRSARIELTQILPAPAPAPVAPPQPQSPAPTTPAPTPAFHPVAEAGPEALDLKLRQAEHLLTLQRQEEAAFTFQQALSLDPGNARALQGLERCRKPGGRVPPSAPRAVPAPPQEAPLQLIAMVEEEPAAPREPRGIEPPAALLKAAPARREGLPMPERIREAAERLPWMRDRRVLAGGAGGLLLLILGSVTFHGYRKDQALREEVRAARAAALSPVSQQGQVADLSESAEAIRQEAESALVPDPLRAYFRAETLVNRNPGDAAAAQLLEKARAGLPGGVTGASLPEYQKHLQNGDLEAAAKVMEALLREQPSYEELRSRAARLYLALCSAHAAQGKWEAAREDLLHGRALRPADKTWQARLQLLEQVKAMPKVQQAAWISLLG